MHELIYLSEQKLRASLLGATDPRFPLLSGSLEAPLGPVTAQVSLGGSAPTTEVTETALERAIRRLVKHHAPSSMDSPSFRPNQWIHFDLDLALRTAHEDSGTVPDDVALFVGTSPSSGPVAAETGVLLCGSVQHLRTQVESAGRMGSDTSWLHEMIAEIARRDAQGIGVIPEFLTELVPSRRSIGSVEEAAYGVHLWMSREYPPRKRNRMQGYAKVLIDAGPPDFIHRLVVATPLLVEIAPQRPAREGWWRRGVGRSRNALS
ncbi:SAVMC3_10250 family protein [Streptomyces koyangensis]